MLLVAIVPRAVAQQAPATAARSALLVVDAQVDVLRAVHDRERVVRNLAELVRKARAGGVPVIWVQHSDAELRRGSDGWKLAPEFVPAAGEAVVHKTYNSSFAETDLEQRLRALGITRIVLAGAATNWCIRATAYAALDRGYDLLLASDAHSTEPMTLDDGTVIPAQSIVAELNATLRWLAVPKVRVDVRPTAGVVF
ncbi:MAG: cysteine hydrolase [Rubrivivax sp.]|jgi:nicotinamidase-related amidase|nr:cysteine hydrolase [Rubrivivax sp.]